MQAQHSPWNWFNTNNWSSSLETEHLKWGDIYCTTIHYSDISIFLFNPYKIWIKVSVNMISIWGMNTELRPKAALIMAMKKQPVTFSTTHINQHGNVRSKMVKGSMIRTSKSDQPQLHDNFTLDVALQVSSIPSTAWQASLILGCRKVPECIMSESLHTERRCKDPTLSSSVHSDHDKSIGQYWVSVKSFKFSISYLYTCRDKYMSVNYM